MDHIHYYNKEAKEQPDPTFESDNMLSNLIETAEADMMKDHAELVTDEPVREIVTLTRYHVHKKAHVDDKVPTLSADNEIEKLINMKDHAESVTDKPVHEMITPTKYHVHKKAHVNAKVPTVPAENKTEKLLGMKDHAESVTDKLVHEMITPTRKAHVDAEVPILPADNEIEKLLELKHELVQVEEQENSIAPAQLDVKENGTEYILNEDEITDKDLINDEGDDKEESESKPEKDKEKTEESSESGERDGVEAVDEVEEVKKVDEVDWEDKLDAQAQSEEALLKRTHSRNHDSYDAAGHAVHQRKNDILENMYQQNEAQADQYIKSDKSLQNKTGVAILEIIS